MGTAVDQDQKMLELDGSLGTSRKDMQGRIRLKLKLPVTTNPRGGSQVHEGYQRLRQSVASAAGFTLFHLNVQTGALKSAPEERVSNSGMEGNRSLTWGIWSCPARS
ncbi:unnamed protein product [Symbiodinium sp. CCMP2456]|nr:unnamed protein product [Symbiodinium sp. CCMP2456]